MAKSLYIGTLGPRSGKTFVLLGVLELLSRRIEKLGFFRPVIRSLDQPDNDIELVRSRFNIDLPYESMYAYRLKKYIGAYYAGLGRVDGIVFTAGIGENAAEIRARACGGLSGLGIAVDPRKNEARSKGAREIQTDDGSVRVLVIPTDEELEIAEETVECIQRSG
jgi:acetate kinase